MRYIVLLFICIGILCVFTVMDAPLKRCGISRFAAAYVAFAFALAALVPPFTSPHLSVSLQFMLAAVGIIIVMVRRRGNFMGLRLLGAGIFSAVFCFSSLLLTGIGAADIAPVLTVLGAALYCQAIAAGSDDAFFLTMCCVWGGQLVAGVYEAAINDYVSFDMASETQAAYAAAAALAAYFIKDITIYVRRRLTKSRA